MLRSICFKRQPLVVPIRTITRSGQNLNGEGKKSATLKRVQEELEADKKKLQWRKPRSDEWTTKLRFFLNSEQTSDYILMMQKPIDIRPSVLLKAWDKRKEKRERYMQQFIAERHETLGPDLAAAHFILYRGGAVRFTKDNKWWRANEDREFDLPTKYDPSYKVEALRCDNMKLYYEGLENLRWLQHLKFLSFYNVGTFDDWCLDRVSGSQYPKLEVLDISGTKCTSRGLSCLYRLSTLKLLVVDDPKQSLEYELTCAMAEEALPNLKIVNAGAVHNL